MSLQPLIRLLQLASPALPVGAYTYSQGLEWAIESGVVRDEASTLRWLRDQLEFNLGSYEGPMLVRFLAAWSDQDWPAVAVLNDRYLASRESAELLAETLQMGYSLNRLLHELGDLPDWLLTQCAVSPRLSFACAWSGVAVAWQIPVRDALAAWFWCWAENQTMAALKAVPLGQAAGQRILSAMSNVIPQTVDHAIELTDDQLSNFAPGFAIACARHETQYSRLFRS